MSFPLKSELLALDELMPELLSLDPQHLIPDLYEYGVVDVQEAGDILDQSRSLPERMFLLLKYSFSPYKDIPCSPFMALVFALMKHHPSLAVNIRQQQAKIEQAFSYQSCTRPELFATYQQIFFGDDEVRTGLPPPSCHQAAMPCGSQHEDHYVWEECMDLSDGCYDDEEMTASNDHLPFYKIPPLVDEIDNKKLSDSLDAVEMKYQELIENENWSSFRKLTRLLKHYCNRIPLFLEILYGCRARKHIRKHEPLDALALATMLMNSQRSMKKSNRLVINTLGLMVEIYNSMGWVQATEEYFVVALQMASFHTTSFTKIRLSRTVAIYFARGFYTTERCFWLRPEYDTKVRATEWFRMTMALLISWKPCDSLTLHSSLLFAEFLVQSRWYHEGTLGMEPRHVAFEDRHDAEKLLEFVKSRLDHSTVSTRLRTQYLVALFDYGICCNNYMLSLTIQEQSDDLDGDLFNGLLNSWFPFGEPPLPEVDDAGGILSKPRRSVKYAHLDATYSGRGLGGDRDLMIADFDTTDARIYDQMQNTTFC